MGDTCSKIKIKIKRRKEKKINVKEPGRLVES